MPRGALCLPASSASRVATAMTGVYRLQQHMVGTLGASGLCGSHKSVSGDSHNVARQATLTTKRAQHSPGNGEGQSSGAQPSGGAPNQGQLPQLQKQQPQQQKEQEDDTIRPWHPQQEPQGAMQQPKATAFGYVFEDDPTYILSYNLFF